MRPMLRKPASNERALAEEIPTLTDTPACAASPTPAPTKRSRSRWRPPRCSRLEPPRRCPSPACWRCPTSSTRAATADGSMTIRCWRLPNGWAPWPWPPWPADGSGLLRLRFAPRRLAPRRLAPRGFGRGCARGLGCTRGSRALGGRVQLLGQGRQLALDRRQPRLDAARREPAVQPLQTVLDALETM